MTPSQRSGYLSTKTTDEPKLFYTLFSPDAISVKATLLIIHGMQEHSGRYSDIAEYFAYRGVCVLTYDHLGHGKSVRDRKDIGFFQKDAPDERLINDAITMSTYLKEQHPDVPHFILGHSMGSFITRCLLQRIGDQFSGAIITGTGGPLTGINLVKTYFSLANKIAPHTKTFFNSLFNTINNSHFKKENNFSDTSWLSLNPTNRNAFSQDELCGIPFTNNAFYALFSIYKKATARTWADPIPRSLPLLLVSGQDDPIGNFGKGVSETVTHLKEDAFEGVSLKLYPKMRHEILNEEIREELLHEIGEWISKHL